MHEPSRPPANSYRDASALATRAREVLDQRCVGCHGCYDAPCQLKLTNSEGIARGGTKLLVYDGARSRAVPPTRLGIDVRGIAAWRRLGFHSVLGSPTDNPNAPSILRRMLDLKKQHPLPSGTYLPTDMEIGINRKHICPNWDEMGAYEREHPDWGMPYALPGLSAEEDTTLRAWLEVGAPTLSPKPLPPTTKRHIAALESWLNDPRPGRELVARYIYEHLFLASLYIEPEAKAPAHWFRLIRSSTPAGQEPQEIPTRLSIDPVPGPVYYRLIERNETVLAKTHLRYSFGPTRIKRWEQLFGGFEPHEDTQVPGSSNARSNPFRTFGSLPMSSRYKFLLDDAGFFLGGFIKGPVCRGQTALNVIQDRFWVFFLDPDSQTSEAMSSFLRDVHDTLELPSEDGSQSSLARWLEYAVELERYLEQKRQFIEKEAEREKHGDSPLWLGDGINPNATLTVFRHHDSATVVQGLVGSDPKTSWILSYPELERIHYLLVAGFDVFGNIGHQVNTRLYMDILRMEGEFNFSLLMDRRERKRLIQWWYRGVGGLKKYWIAQQLEKTTMAGVWETQGIRRQSQVYAKLKTMFQKVDRGNQWNLNGSPADPIAQTLKPIATAPPEVATLFPEMTLIEVIGPQNRLFTLLRDSAFSNVARLLLDQERRRPKEDQLGIYQGVVGSYPNAILRIHESELAAFVDAIQNTRTETDYAALLTRFGIRRTNPEFWAVSDEIHTAYAQIDPLEYGRLDYNRLENR